MQWFESWFDSPYYPILYSHRDHQEAATFIERIIQFLKLPKGAVCLDLACGRGRHAKCMYDCGMKVVGIDLSPASILDAQKNYQCDGLRFFTGDMRTFQIESAFDAVFNLFTSFGYFKDPSENMQVLTQIKKHLKNEGVLILDYLNAGHPDVKDFSTKTIDKDSVLFETQKEIIGDHIVKHIKVLDGKQTYCFREEVQLLTLTWFQEALHVLNFEVKAVFGDYHLNAYDERVSKRMILVAYKKA
jgi:SAM-dependent methyltransferase